uniref:hypothetical protein n=1 Tax=Dialister sp. TaxID=1955814 RepID=UPI004027F46B
MENVTISELLANGAKIVRTGENTVTIYTPNGKAIMGDWGEYPTEVVRKYDVRTGALLERYTRTILG